MPSCRGKHIQRWPLAAIPRNIQQKRMSGSKAKATIALSNREVVWYFTGLLGAMKPPANALFSAHARELAGRTAPNA
jgi:hypothetical protein